MAKKSNLIPSQDRGDGTGLGCEVREINWRPESIREHPCYGCIHFRGRYFTDYCCNYIFDTGYRRTCEPGAACIVKTVDPVSKEKENKKRKRIELR